jgi:hypothetical protein
LLVGKGKQLISYIPDHCMIAKNLVVCPRLV